MHQFSRKRVFLIFSAQNKYIFTRKIVKRLVITWLSIYMYFTVRGRGRLRCRKLPYLVGKCHCVNELRLIVDTNDLFNDPTLHLVGTDNWVLRGIKVWKCYFQKWNFKGVRGAFWVHKWYKCTSIWSYSFVSALTRFIWWSWIKNKQRWMDPSWWMSAAHRVWPIYF